MEHEGLDAEQPKFACRRREGVKPLLHGVADVNQRAHASRARFVESVAQNFFADLRAAASTSDARHQRAKPFAS